MTSRSIHSVITRVSVFMQSSALTCSACIERFAVTIFSYLCLCCINRTWHSCRHSNASSMHCGVVNRRLSHLLLSFMVVNCSVHCLWTSSEIVLARVMEFVLPITRLHYTEATTTAYMSIFHCGRQTTLVPLRTLYYLGFTKSSFYSKLI